ncbi:hypothetical protein [Gloeocapsopsis dulcis]|uniref:hypothetical protein n=1 Tax=Gloeocapsopsis dulcis TaxID=2859516 RepID=UPI0018C84F29|nr:hypothetical protein [Gloeocapsopsis dulcis]WNN89276.1 hypothetical protein P0S91_24070 [Gloeocapsopsis dulcis]
MRELTYYVACSVDGFIAQKDGSHNGFSQDSEYVADLVATFPETVPSHLRDVMGIDAENKWFDVVLMGRKTYEVGLNVGVTNPFRTWNSTSSHAAWAKAQVSWSLTTK